MVRSTYHGIPTSRVFGGKKFEQHTRHTTKNAAKDSARKLRNIGFFARVTRYQGAFPWVVFTRRKS